MALDVAKLVGTYENVAYQGEDKNDWHYVTLTRGDGDNIIWKNLAGVSWSLMPDGSDSTMAVGEDCPYFDQGFQTMGVIFDGHNNVLKIMGPGNEPYLRTSQRDITTNLLRELQHRLNVANLGTGDVPGMVADAQVTLDAYIAMDPTLRMDFVQGLTQEHADMLADISQRGTALQNSNIDLINQGQQPVVEDAYNAGVLYMQAGDDSAAQSMMEYTLQLDPDHPTAKNDLGYLRTRGALRSKQQDSGARDMLREALSKNTDLSTLNSYLADKYHGDFDTIVNDPMKYGLSLMQFGLYSEARKAFETVLQSDPENASAYHNLSLCYSADVLVDKALSSAITALTMDPTLPFNNLIHAALVAKFGLDYAAARS